MTGISDTSHDTPTSSRQGPGRLVREARERARLSTEDLAAQIKLARVTLDAIERDDFAQLNEPVYVRGYYRKLAKVLPVTEAELISAYEAVAGQKAPPHPSKLILAGGPELGSARRISLKFAIALILGGLFIGALAFWGKNRSAQPAVTPPPAAESPAATESAPPTAMAVPGTTEPPTVPPASAPAATPAPQAAAPLAAEPSATNTTGPLLLQFNGTSWAEVRDAAGRVLLSGLVEAGNSQTLDGRPPFEIVLGNAPVVRISYQGQAVDMAPHRRSDNTARLTLP